MTSGIYRITNTINNKHYVGSSKNIEQRFSAHRSKLSKGIHPNCHLQSAWKKYGEEAFEFVVVLECPEEQLLENEDRFISSMSACDRSVGYNIRPSASRTVISEETKKKLSEAASQHTGWSHTEATKAKMSNNNTTKKACRQLTLDGQIVTEFTSTAAAAVAICGEYQTKLFWSKAANIASCCRGLRPTAFGFKWQYI
jgi:group I intron endonuclease